MSDKTFKCVETVCGNAEFVVTKSEQEFFEKKKLSLPKRCPDCRERRRKEKEAQGGNGERR